MMGSFRSYLYDAITSTTIELRSHCLKDGYSKAHANLLARKSSLWYYLELRYAAIILLLSNFPSLI